MSCPAVIHVYAATGLPKAVVVTTPGPVGPIGSRWLGGTAAPATNLGVAGDWYLRANGDVYGPKGASGWGSVVFTLSPAQSSGGVQSVSLTPPAGWSSSSTNTGGSVVLTLALPAGYSLPSNTSQAQWDTAYSERLRWDGGSTGLNAATARASLQLGTAAQAATTDFATPAALATGLSGKADLVGGVIPSSQIPAIAISEYLGAAADQAAMLALSGQRGDWCIRTDRQRAWILSGDNAAQLANWVELPTPIDAITSVNGQTGVVVLGPADVGAATAAQGALAATAVQPGNLGTFATANAATPPAIGGTTPAAGAFTVLTATAALTLPGAAAGTPAVGDLYRVLNTLRYRDSTNAERLLLNATDNLANLASPATARTNLGAAATPNWYKVGNWIMPAPVALANGAAYINNRIFLTPFSVSRSITIDELAARVTTALAGSLFQLAIYGSSAGMHTGLPLASTSSLSGASATVLSGAVTQFTMLAGEIYWMAANASGSANSLVFSTPHGSSVAYASSILGCESLAAVASLSAQFQWNRWVDQTFGTWPNLTGVTSSIISDRYAPAIFMKVAALP